MLYKNRSCSLVRIGIQCNHQLIYCCCSKFYYDCTSLLRFCIRKLFIGRFLIQRIFLPYIHKRNTVNSLIIFSQLIQITVIQPTHSNHCYCSYNSVLDDRILKHSCLSLVVKLGLLGCTDQHILEDTKSVRLLIGQSQVATRCQR